MFDNRCWNRLSLFCALLFVSVIADAQTQSLEEQIGLIDARKRVHSACPESWQSIYSRIIYEKLAVNGDFRFPDIWSGNSNDKALYLSYAFNTLLPISQHSGAELTVALASQDAAVITACASERGSLFNILDRNANDNMGGEGGFNVNVVRDDDSDGIFNMIDGCPTEVFTCSVIWDLCPDTPVDEVVDTEGDFIGCSLSQKDTDNDGINDAIDTCPFTPSGEVADVDGRFTGCSISQKDTDGDGLNDDKDLCPDSDGEFEVNVDGCAINQIDTDGDGINDFDDPYPHQDESMCYPY